MSRALPQAKPSSMPSRLAILALVMTIVGAVAITLGVYFHLISLTTALATWVICSIAALAAHVVGEYPQGDLYITARMALQMAVRTAPPFGFALWALHFAAPPLEKSLVFYMILFYFVGMIADVQLTLRRLNADAWDGFPKNRINYSKKEI